MRTVIIISAAIVLLGGGIALVMIKRRRKDPQSALAALHSEPEPPPPPPPPPTLPLPGNLLESAVTDAEKKLLDQFCKLPRTMLPSLGSGLSGTGLSSPMTDIMRESENASSQYGIAKKIWLKSGGPGPAFDFYVQIKTWKKC